MKLSPLDIAVLQSTMATWDIRPTLAYIHIQDWYYFSTDSFRIYRIRHDWPTDIHTTRQITIAQFFSQKNLEQSVPLKAFYPILDACKTKAFNKIIFSPQDNDTLATAISRDWTMKSEIILKDIRIDCILDCNLFYTMLKPFYTEKKRKDFYTISFKQDTPLSPFQFIVDNRYEWLIMPIKK